MELLKAIETVIIERSRSNRQIGDFSLQLDPISNPEIKNFESSIESGVVRQIISETDEEVSYKEISRTENPVDWAIYWLNKHPLIPMVYYKITMSPKRASDTYKTLVNCGFIRFIEEIVETSINAVDEVVNNVDSMLLGVGYGTFNIRFIEAKLMKLANDYKNDHDNTSLIAGSSFVAFLADKPTFTPVKILYYILNKVENSTGVKFPLKFTVCSGNLNDEIDNKEIDATNDELADLIHHTSQIFVNRNLEKVFGLNNDMMSFPFYRPSERAMDAMSQSLVAFFTNNVQQS